MTLTWILVFLSTQLSIGFIRSKHAPKLLRDPSEEEAAAYNCELGCIRDLVTAIQPLGVDVAAGLNVGSRLFGRTEAEIRAFCSSYIAGASCIRRCEARPGRRVLAQMFAAFDYMCVAEFDELLSHVPCLNASQPSVAAVCDDECGTESVLTDHPKVQSALDTQDFERLNRALGSICEVIQCSLGCQRPIISAACGEEGAFRYLRGFVRAAFRPIKGLVVSSMGANATWAQSCEALTAPGIRFREEALVELFTDAPVAAAAVFPSPPLLLPFLAAACLSV